MSLKSRLVAAASVFTLIASGCATTQQGSGPGGGSSTVEELPNEGGGQQGAAQAPPAGPQLNDVGTPEDGFTVKMPGTANVARNKVTIASGDVNIATWNSAVEGVIYALTATDYPTKFVATRAPETIINKEGRDVLIGQLKGTLKSEENITINDMYPGKALVIASDNGEVKARVYLVGPRLYTLLAVYNPSIGAPAVDPFLQSLTLINPPPPVERERKGSTTGTTGTGTTGTGTPGTGTTEGTTAPTPGGTTPAPGGTTSPGTDPTKK
jgi:hypothetical protein